MVYNCRTCAKCWIRSSKTLQLPFYVNNIASKGIYNGTLSLAVSIIVYIGVSYMTKEQQLDREMEALLDA